MTAQSNKDIPATEVKEPRSGGGLAFVAVLVAIGALIVAGFAVWQTQELGQLRVQSNDQNGDQGSRIARLRGDLTGRLDQYFGETEALAQAVVGLQTSLEQTLSAAAQLEVRQEQLAVQIATLPTISSQQRNAFLKSEALYYLRIANAQALMVRDAKVAASALQMADDKLREAADPALAVVRAKLSEELTAMRAVPDIDRLGISLRLQALAGQTHEWPFANPVPERFASGLPELDEVAGEGPWERFEATLRAVFESIVSVRESDVPPEMQLGKAEQALLIASVRAELQLARLAIVAGEPELFGASLQRVASVIDKEFDAESSIVQAARQAIAELADTEMPGALPEISGALTLMLSEGSLTVVGAQ